LQKEKDNAIRLMEVKAGLIGMTSEPVVAAFCGIPLEEFTKDELIKIMSILSRTQLHFFKFK